MSLCIEFTKCIDDWKAKMKTLNVYLNSIENINEQMSEIQSAQSDPLFQVVPKQVILGKQSSEKNRLQGFIKEELRKFFPIFQRFVSIHRKLCRMSCIDWNVCGISSQRLLIFMDSFVAQLSLNMQLLLIQPCDLRKALELPLADYEEIHYLMNIYSKTK